MSDAIPSRPPLRPEEGWRPPSRDFFGGPPPAISEPRGPHGHTWHLCSAGPANPTNIPNEPVGEVPPEFVFTAGGAIAAPSQASRYATFKPLLDRIGPGAGAMVERELDRARAFEVIARAAVAYIEADGVLDPYGSDYEALSEAVEENVWAVRPRE